MTRSGLDRLPRWGVNAILLAVGLVLLCVAAAMTLTFRNSRYTLLFFIPGGVFAVPNALYLIAYGLYQTRRPR